MLIIKHKLKSDVDFSEEWLEYLVMRNKDDDGSTSDVNFEAFFDHGSAGEKLYPYIGEEWEKLEKGTLSEQRCGHLKGKVLKSCLLAHRDPSLLDLPDAELTQKDPEFLQARKEASEIRDQYLKRDPKKDVSLSFTQEVKALLAWGIPVTVELDFYYGAWNHSEATKLKIPRDRDSWKKGIVGYPLKGSKDEINSEKDPAGHSIVLVGYDDTVEVSLKHEMPGGSIVEKTYRGVYYFKNSWGTDGFGKEFEVDGKVYPGYGMMVQKYANEYGSFYQLPLE